MEAYLSQSNPDAPHVPNSLSDDVVNLFLTSDHSKEEKRQEVEADNPAIHADLIWNLTQLRFHEAQALEHWNNLLHHQQEMEKKLGREVGVRVAAFDYFVNVVGELQNPRVVDPSLLDRLYRDAVVDPLTQMPNRRAYSSRLAEEISRSARYHSSFVIAVFDVDNFKQINDDHGHATGDRILQGISRSMKKSIRRSDFIARWGGEEFVVLMPETHKSGGLVFAERLRNSVEKDLAENEVTISGGIAAYPEDGSSEKALFAFADRALYRAKAEGKNRICLTPHERRAYPRLDHNLEVTLTPLPMKNARVNTMTSNVGVGGVAVRYNEARAISAQVQGSIKAKDKTATFVGRVVFVEELTPNEFELGIEFVDIDIEQWEIIMENVC